MTNEQLNDLVSRAVRGDNSAFEELYRQSQRSVYFICLKMLRDEQTAMDAAQETYITAYRKLSQLDSGENFLKWINGIAANKCRQLYPSEPTDSLEEQTEQGLELTDESFIPEDYADDAEKRRIIMEIIENSLTDVQRQTVLLYYYNQMTVPEISRTMECTESAVKYRLVTARERIKEAVLIYEKEHDDRLHGILPVPVLTRILRAEAEKITVPDIRLDLSKAAEPSASKIMKNTGGAKMKNTLALKIIAGVAAAGVVGGGIALAVSKGGSKDSEETSAPAVTRPAAPGESTAPAADGGAASTTSPDTVPDVTPGGKYIKDNLTYPTANGEIAPYIKIGDEKLSAPFTLDDFFRDDSPLKSYSFPDEEIADISEFSGNNSVSLAGNGEIKIRCPEPWHEAVILNIYDRDRPYSDVYADGVFTTGCGFGSIFNADDFTRENKYGTDYYIDGSEVNKVFEEFGLPTSAYETSPNSYQFYWETNAYTFSWSAVEFDTTRYYWYPGDFTYYSAGYPEDEIYKLSDQAVTLWNNGKIEIADYTPGEQSSTPQTTEKYPDLQELTLEGELTAESITATFEGKEVEITPDLAQEELDSTLGYAKDEKENDYNYGNYDVLNGYPLSFNYARNSDGEYVLKDIRAGFGSTQEVSLLGVTAYSSPQDIVSILGTPESVSKVYINTASRTQTMSWSGIQIGDTLVDYIVIEYMNG